MYFEQGAPFVEYTTYRINPFLIKNYGYDDVRKMILNNSFDKQELCIRSVWECIDEDRISEDISKDFSKYIFEQNGNYIPDCLVLSKFLKYDKSLMNNALRILLEDKYAAKCFLDGCIMRNKVPFIMEMFKDDLVTLKRMYLNTLETGFDRKGTLFWELYRTDPEIWKQYIDCLAEINYHEYYESSIIEHMWEQQEYKVNILYAFITLIEKQVFSRDKVIHMIFGRKENEYRKKEWLLSQLYKEDNCLERFKTLIYVVTVAYPEWEIEYVVKYLKINQSIEDFKRINLFPMMQSWTGSEIPLISRRIDFLLSLKNKINGLEYLDHKLYLDELINNEEKRKEEVELDEYIESFL